VRNKYRPHSVVPRYNDRLFRKMKSGMGENMRVILLGICLCICPIFALAADHLFVSLKDFSRQEMKSSGFELRTRTEVFVSATGSGGGKGWGRSSDVLDAYGWILDARTRKLVWKMDGSNTHRKGAERSFEGSITLDAGKYEVYFTAPIFSHDGFFSHITANVDHRNDPLFHSRHDEWDIVQFFKNWWSDDLSRDWAKRSPHWGIELKVDKRDASVVHVFSAPADLPNVVLSEKAIGEYATVRRALRVSSPTRVNIYALGEGVGKYEMSDFAWIVRKDDRTRVWEMLWRTSTHAGGAEKNRECRDALRLEKGDYVVYYVSDGSHSSIDWNARPPFDPEYWGITLWTDDEKEKDNVTLIPYKETDHVIARITKVGDDESRQVGFLLREESPVRVYAFGERGNSRGLLADYGLIRDARTREKVWTMEIDKTHHAGGASKNRFVDEVVVLPRGAYLVSYITDDSHSYHDWNSDPPFDPEHYGITIMGFGSRFNPASVGEYNPERDNIVIAQIVRVGDDADERREFAVEKTTRVRIYALGEGLNKRLYDYGWIEDAATGRIVWEMDYSRTFHAGGHRKNRMMNTTTVLEKGRYLLRYQSDDSHSYRDWNVDPPEDQPSWGITVYRDEETP
jgi:hypothetical protein